jgi:CxxC motif-containing protein
MTELLKNKVLKNLICIACPNGCRLEVIYNDSGEGEITVHGHHCKRGEDYAREEIISPKRTVTAVVATDSKTLPFVPVRTDRPLPVNLIDPLLKEIYALRLAGPMEMGQRVIKDFRRSGVNVIVTRPVLE